ncbi:hypothetical protein ACFFRR_008145 [Megaselia abdita]
MRRTLGTDLWLVVIISVITVNFSGFVLGLSVDNQLVNARNDCFDRIALEAMLPFEKAFRTEDTNSLKVCKDKCIQAGEKCNIIAFGVHRRGNGTCQLSSEKFDASQPMGTIFDPDFDMYSRNANCFKLDDKDNNIPSISQSDPHTTTLNIADPTITTVLHTDPGNGYHTHHTVLPHPDSDTTIHAERPTYTTYTAVDHEVGYPVGTTLPTYHVYHPTDWSAENNDKVVYSHDPNPLYQFPMLYEPNYPAPNDNVYYPGGYAQNVPTLEDRYKPGPSSTAQNTQSPSHKPVFGSGYGNGYSYGTPVSLSTTRRPQNDYRPSSRRPSTGYDRPGGSYDRPTGGYDDSTYYNRDRVGDRVGDRDRERNRPRPDYNRQDSGRPYGSKDRDYGYTNKDRDNGYGNRDYNNRPDPSYDNNKQGTRRPSSSSPSTSYGQTNPMYNPNRIGNSSYSSNKTITTYFNPEDYYNSKPGSGVMGSKYGDQGDSITSCFRRVLAGKRIAPQWVRRTLSCERVEDCMKECGHEKRFMCEGFNYKIDPSGHGQGDCELVEVPLAQMDLYSSPRSRDSNLIRHPDYDYYERDRNAPSSCRKHPCKECSQRPSYKPIGFQDDHYPPPSNVDRYGPSSTGFDSYPSGPDYHYSDDFSSWSPSTYGDISDRYDSVRPSDHNRPDRWESIPSGFDSYHHRKHHGSSSDSSQFRPPYKPGSGYSPYRPSHYLDRDPPPMSKPSPQQSKKFVPYLIGTAEEDWGTGTYGGSYGGSSSSHRRPDPWSSQGNRRKDQFDLSYPKPGFKDTPYSPNSISGSRYGDEGFRDRDRNDYRQQWTRRPGPDECSVKTSEGFRLHKTAIKHSFNVPTITECERLCSDENGFICHTYSYRYANMGRDNCMLCDRTVNHLDYYVDLEPDRDYDIYSMSDDMSTCREPIPPPHHPSPPYHGRGGSESTAVAHPRSQAQCFFRAIDATRFFKSIVRDSLTVRSIGQCELECIKSTKFTCRAFAFRYGQSHSKTVIDNCQLSDWPVRDMDKERHLVLDPGFDVFERASYGHGCELQPIMDDKHKKLCYLGYGSAAKLLSTAIKKVISVPSESECKKECIRYRENTPFKCFSFSYGSQSTSFNCEMSDLDQSELKLNIHYVHTNDRDYWLFAWNPFDWTCRDKVNTIGGNRVNNDRRMDIFREPGKLKILTFNCNCTHL